VDTNRLLVCMLGVICCGAILAIAVLSGINREIHPAITACASASLGALLALAHPVDRREK
jgi:hypothetical protein